MLVNLQAHCLTPRNAQLLLQIIIFTCFSTRKSDKLPALKFLAPLSSWPIHPMPHMLSLWILKPFPHKVPVSSKTQRAGPNFPLSVKNITDS